MRLTERDLAILAALQRYRFLTSQHIQMLDGGGYAAVMRLMRTLYDNKLVDLPRAQIADLIAHGQAPNAYALAQEGAKALSIIEGSDIERARWTLKNTRVKPRFVRHTTGIASVIVPIEVACRDDRAPNLIDHLDLLPTFPEATQKASNPFLWKAKVTLGSQSEKVGLVPDRLFSLVFADNTRRNYALEFDTGEMPIARRSLKGTSIKKKMLGYLAGWKAHETNKWNMQRLRILLVTPSEKRKANMIATLYDITGGRGSGMFLFSTLDDITREGSLAPIWESGKDGTVSLTD